MKKQVSPVVTVIVIVVVVVVVALLWTKFSSPPKDASGTGSGGMVSATKIDVKAAMKESEDARMKLKRAPEAEETSKEGEE